MAFVIDRASDGEMLGLFGRALLPSTAVVMTIVGLFATIGPARRSLRIQPTKALRAE
jgi:ABC-type antimicrobial peptide transport system permease subunit